MTSVRALVYAVMMCLCVLASAQGASAQSNDEVFPQFQFNFSTPGARANAIGGAFIGLADDASASITNPAGLVRLRRPQVYFEFKATDLKVKRLANVRSLFTLESTTFEKTITAPAFLSVSVPLGDRIAVAFTRHEFLNYEEEFTLDPRPIPSSDFVFFGVDGNTDFSGVSYAGSVAFSVDPKLRVGVTISRDSLSANSVATRFRTRFDSVTDRFAVTRTEIIVNRTTIDENSSGTSAVLGVLALPSDKVSFGVQYSKGASFEIDEFLSTNNSTSTNLPLQPASGFPKTVKINVPDRVGFGVAARPHARLLTALDVVWIGYSSLAKDFTVIFEDDVLDSGNFAVDDAVEVHAGAEYLLLTGERRLFVRAGLFTSPDHATRFLGSGDPDTNASETAKYNLLPRETAVVGTFGVGLAVGGRFQLDLAYVVNREFVASAGLRF